MTSGDRSYAGAIVDFSVLLGLLSLSLMREVRGLERRVKYTVSLGSEEISLESQLPSKARWWSGRLLLGTSIILGDLMDYGVV